VKPYKYTFHVHAKKRWFNRPLIEVMAEEFQGYPPEYYKRAVERGRIRVNGERVDADYLVRNGDRITYFLSLILSFTNDTHLFDIDAHKYMYMHMWSCVGLIFINKVMSFIVMSHR
jgi:23S rRNA-/tRNA-specific pseudouridylate synthase